MATGRREERDAAAVAAVAAAGIGGGFAVVALATHGSRAALSVAVGAFLAVANLVTLRAIIRSIVQPPDGEEPNEPSTELERRADRDDTTADEENIEGPAEGDTSDDAPAPKARGTPQDHASDGRRGGAAWGVFAILKILVLFGGIWLLLTRGVVDPIPLVVGYGVLPLGIVAASLFTGRRAAGQRKPSPRR